MNKKWNLLCFSLIFLLTACSTLPHNFVEADLKVGINDDIPDIDIPDVELDYSQLSNLSSKPQAWGLGKDLTAEGQPVDAVAANEKYKMYDTVFVGKTNQKVYLTFDNGYENGNTPSILDTLKEKKVSAVFFVTSQYVLENPELIQRMIDEGHIIGNHSYHHPSFITISMEKITEEIMTLDQLMLDRFQYKMNLIRPPKGEFTERSCAISNLLGYQTVLWSYAYYDYNVNDQPDTTSSLKKNLDNAHPGAIYLLHSVSDTNMKILPDLIDGLRQLNYDVARYDLNQ